MTRQTDLDDFARELATDGGQPEDDEEEEHPHYDPSGDSATVTEAWEGAFLSVSWGYGQTNTSFARIVDVSDTGKTVLCKMATPERVDTEKGSERLRPTAETYGDEFRLQVREGSNGPVFRGSYPYIDGDKDEGTRRDTFLPVSNEAGKTYHQTAPGHRH